ncbi:MAG: hypothetical protein AB1324_05620 [Candidatus Micrarchaeota archaeon]
MAGKKGEVVGFGNLTPENIDGVEQETVQKVNQTITVLESAIATWEGSPEKPADLKPKFDRYKKFHDALSEWAGKSLKARGKKEEFGDKLKRLREFVDICHAYG